MATVYNPNPQDQQQTYGQGTQSGAQPGPITPGSQGAGGQGSQPAGSQPKGSSSGRFSNINKYIQANTGTDYAGRLGGEIGQKADSLQQGIQQGRQQIQQQAQPELQRLQQSGQTIQQATTDPTAFAQNQQNVDAFNKLRQGQYMQGVNVQNEAQLANQAQALQQQAQMAGTEQGRFQLLRQSFGDTTPRYTSGQQRLDQLLLQGQGGQLKNLQQNAAQQSAAQQAALQGLQGEAASTTAQLQNLGKTAQQQAQEAITGTVSTQQQALQQKAQALQQQREEQLAGFKSGLQKGELTEEQAQQLGLDINNPESLRMMNIDPTQLLSESAIGKAGVGNVATAEDQARFQALSKLSGQQELEGYANPQGALQDVGKAFDVGTFAKQQAGARQQALETQGYGGWNLKQLQEQQGQSAAKQQRAQQAEALLKSTNPGDWEKGQAMLEQVRQEAGSGAPLAASGNLAWLRGASPINLAGGGQVQGLRALEDISGLWGNEESARQASAQQLAQQTGYDRMLKIIKAKQAAGA